MAFVMLLALVAGERCSWAQASSEDQIALFENRVRPLLVEHCIRCHGPTKSESSLRLDTRETLLAGGLSGPAAIPGQPEQSLIVKAIRHAEGLEMPPDGKLAEHEIAAIERWIGDGAYWPEGVALDGPGPRMRGGPITDQERAFWSFQPLADPEPPPIVDGGELAPIDRFLRRKLHENGLEPMPPATRRAWLRRATFDLTGLPPTPADVQAFLEDDSPGAEAAVIERLLASRAYGERWGRHWLDVVRYADTAGETADYPTPLAYKYRNWVINAFNADMPYDEFVRQQVAGDVLADRMLAAARAGSPDEDLDEPLLAKYRDMRIATGFIAISRRFGFDVENYHHLTIQDTIDVVGQAMLGLTLGCARCHDHKYDPVNVADYYAWYGIFASTRYSFPGSEEKKRPYDLFPVLPAALAAREQAAFDARIATLNAEISQLEAQMKAQASEAAGQRLGELTAERAALQKAGPYEVHYGAVDQDAPQDSRIQLRGDPMRLGDEAARRNLEILGGEPLPADAGSGRWQLAEWLTREDNPLLARVMVNRIWQQHFGQGLVATENDFGARGARPTHPELLDWLASRFKESGYSVKAMHRLIMNTAAYRRSSAYAAAAAEKDPDARLVWRFNRRRLSAEEIRDAMLLVSGKLEPAMGGEHPFPAVDTWGFTQHNPYYGVYPTKLRSVYLMQQRLKRHPFLGLFDGADANVSTARRELTTVPTQALFLMNNEFVHEQAAGFANRLIAAADHDADRIALAYEIALGRPVTAGEQQGSAEFLAAYREAAGTLPATSEAPDRIAWEAFARTLLTRNEFLFVD